jgi:hypothetical protein
MLKSVKKSNAFLNICDNAWLYMPCKVKRGLMSVGHFMHSALRKSSSAFVLRSFNATENNHIKLDYHFPLYLICHVPLVWNDLISDKSAISIFEVKRVLLQTSIVQHGAVPRDRKLTDYSENP